MKRLIRSGLISLVFVFFLSTISYAGALSTNIDSTGTSATETSATGFNVTRLGAKGDGITDDTRAIQAALNTHDNVYIPDGTYMINVEVSLRLRSNQTLTLDDSAILQALPTARVSSSVIRVDGVSGVVISGGQVVGERNSHLGTTGEWGHGILIQNSATDILVKNITVRDCWGDGLYIGGSTTVSNITIDNVISDNNRRQGLSLTNATQVTISNSTFKNTNGTAPQAGIDIEPNDSTIAEDITVINTQCYGNAGSGFQLIGGRGPIHNITVEDSSFTDNVLSGIRIHGADNFTFDNVISTNNYYGLEISGDATDAEFTNMTLSNSRSYGVLIRARKQVKGIENLSFEDCDIYNNSQSRANTMDGVRIENYDLTGYVKDITFSDCNYFDDQAEKTQRYGFSIGYTSKLINIYVSTNSSFYGNIRGDYDMGNGNAKFRDIV